AVDADEVAGARIHRQARLGGEVPVVPLDQLVHLREAPVARELLPRRCELRRILELLGEQPPALTELALVLLDGVLDGAQAAHPGRRPAERPHPRLGTGTEVAQPLPERHSTHRARLEIRFELLALTALARCLGPRRALARRRRAVFRPRLAGLAGDACSLSHHLLQ